MTYGNRRAEKNPVTIAGKSPELAVANGYHITMTPWIEGDTQVREAFNLIGEDGEKAVALRDCILHHCFWELVGETDVQTTLKWHDHASRMRLIQTMKESEIRGVELPTWYTTESKAGEAGLRPSQPMIEERVVDGHEEVTYAIAAKVPECAFCRDEEGVPLLTVVDWVNFIQGRSQGDQERIQGPT